MTPEQIDRLQAASTTVLCLVERKLSPAEIVAELVRDHGAILKTMAWTNTLRFGGLATSCTASADEGLLRNWRNLATLRLAAARQGGFGAER